MPQGEQAVSRIEDRKTTGYIFNIQKYSVHDGPGIRTIAFLKGCHLRCRWCSNPESQLAHPQLAVNNNRCIGTDKCHHCMDACPNDALYVKNDTQIAVHRDLCKDCTDLPCARACPAQGLNVYGELKTVDEVMKVVEQDAPFYARSGGGMTLSGGEPFFQGKFALALLREARARFIRTAVETCGMCDQDVLLEAGKYLNYVLFDIKNMDSEKHREQTGMPNEHILSNLKALCTEFPDKPILVRTPIIPGFNDTPEAVTAIAEFIEPFGSHVEYEMLPYHRLGTQKYEFLDMPARMGDVVLDNVAFKKLFKYAHRVLKERLHIPR